MLIITAVPDIIMHNYAHYNSIIVFYFFLKITFSSSPLEGLPSFCPLWISISATSSLNSLSFSCFFTPVLLASRQYSSHPLLMAISAFCQKRHRFHQWDFAAAWYKATWLKFLSPWGLWQYSTVAAWLWCSMFALTCSYVCIFSDIFTLPTAGISPSIAQGLFLLVPWCYLPGYTFQATGSTLSISSSFNMPFGHDLQMLLLP